jgi:uncharacterized heparinase superfamily protein
MPLQVINILKRRAGHRASGSVFYNWNLRGPAPERMVVRPVDAWGGCTEKGKVFSLGDWCAHGIAPSQFAHIHGFTWLRDLRAASTERGSAAAFRRMARALVESWCEHHPRFEPQSWQADIAGERIAMWLSAYEFFGEDVYDDADEEQAFRDLFFDSVARQARHIARTLSKSAREDLSPIGTLKAIKGLLYAGLAFEGCEHWIAQALDVLSEEINKQILGDGSHRSRAPDQLLAALQIFLDMRMNLRVGDYPCPEKLKMAIERMGPALRFFRYTDKHFALFNGAQKGDMELIDSIAGQAGVRLKTMNSLPCAGFEKISQGRTTVMMDCGAVPAYPYDRAAHAAPLAFEMTYGRERMIVNCGSHPDDPAWQEALRATAAHSALTLANRNACEIKKDGHFARKVQRPSHIREESRNAVLLEGVHDGYVPLNGFAHRRKLYLSDNGNDLRGEDALAATLGPGKPIEFAVRFHLHPRAMVSLIRDGQEALIRLSSGTGWRFQQAGGHLTLEESIYLGQGGQPRKTKQLVIYGQIIEKRHKIKWAFQKEG